MLLVVTKWNTHRLNMRAQVEPQGRDDRAIVEQTGVKGARR